MKLQDVPRAANDAATLVLEAAIAVHRALGPGLFEADYRDCLVHDLQDAGAHLVVEKELALVCRGVVPLRGRRVDLVVNDVLPVELKAVEALHERHFLQARRYVKFGGYPLGILVNFNEARLIDGWHRILPGRAIPEVAATAALPAPPHAGPAEERF